MTTGKFWYAYASGHGDENTIRRADLLERGISVELIATAEAVAKTRPEVPVFIALSRHGYPCTVTYYPTRRYPGEERGA